MYTFLAFYGIMGYFMNTSSLIKVIKNELKLQGITYLEVAKYLKISEAGVKKLFGKDDLTLSKLTSLSQIINIPVMEIMKRAESDEVDVFSFDQKDIQFF
ncbi:MAG: helix-turn-helix transcriptional regulator [Bacteriovoracaceae bacterium]|nr:helix-turn-helix transcriptional regulator [Bacteriovoracaceae bacterium]